METEEIYYINKLHEMKESFRNLEFSKITEKVPALKGLPIKPHRQVFSCLGLWPKEEAVEIKDRYVRVAFNF